MRRSVVTLLVSVTLPAMAWAQTTLQPLCQKQEELTLILGFYVSKVSQLETEQKNIRTILLSQRFAAERGSVILDEKAVRAQQLRQRNIGKDIAFWKTLQSAAQTELKQTTQGLSSARITCTTQKASPPG